MKAGGNCGSSICFFFFFFIRQAGRQTRGQTGRRASRYQGVSWVWSFFFLRGGGEGGLWNFICPRCSLIAFSFRLHFLWLDLRVLFSSLKKLPLSLASLIKKARASNGILSLSRYHLSYHVMPCFSTTNAGDKCDEVMCDVLGRYGTLRTYVAIGLFSVSGTTVKLYMCI